MNIKYVMTKDGRFVVANRTAGFEHRELALLGLGVSFTGEGNPDLSGGFLYCESDGSYSSYGQSVSLGVKSRPEDGQLITDALRDGKARFEYYDHKDCYIAGNHPSMMGPEFEVATRDKMREYRITE